LIVSLQTSKGIWSVYLQSGTASIILKTAMHTEKFNK